MSGITAIKRKGFAGGGKDASGKSFDASANPDRKGGPIGREDRQSMVGAPPSQGGITQFQADNQGFTPAQVANQNYSSGDVRDAKEAAIIKNFKAKKYPVYLPGGTAISFAKNVFGTPFTKGAKKRTANKRMEYINSLDPRSRKAMIDRLGLAMDEDYEEGEVNYGTELYGDPLAMGKNIYGMDAYDVINYDGEFLKKYGQKPIKDNNSNQAYIPINYNMGSGESEDVEEEKTYDYRFGDNQDVIYENYGTPGYRTTAAEGGIMGLRARRAFGGIMDRVTGRKAYGLGSIFKSVKKAASKVLSSDIGKAAMIGAGIYYGGGGGNPFTREGRKAFSFFGNDYGKGFFSKDNRLLFSDRDGEQVFNPMKFAGLITAGGALAGPAKQDSLEGFGNRGGRLKDSQGNDALPADIRAEINEAYASGNSDRINAIQDYYAFLPPTNQYLPYPNYAQGGRIGKAEGGLMDLGGMEKDYRSEGGFVPIGEYEKKDDVPARLSVNEFVFTADAVRGAGQGDIDKGAEIMENMMENLENGGTVSEESQGNKGAQNMFKTSERLGAVI